MWPIRTYRFFTNPYYFSLGRILKESETIVKSLLLLFCAWTDARILRKRNKKNFFYGKHFNKNSIFLFVKHIKLLNSFIVYICIYNLLRNNTARQKFLISSLYRRIKVKYQLEMFLQIFTVSYIKYKTRLKVLKYYITYKVFLGILDIKGKNNFSISWTSS